MSQVKYPANGSMRQSSGPTMSNRAKDVSKTKSYRESGAAATGRTSSGKAVPMSKAGKGAC